jgi:hypothetical protein
VHAQYIQCVRISWLGKLGDVLSYNLCKRVLSYNLCKLCAQACINFFYNLVGSNYTLRMVMGTAMHYNVLLVLLKCDVTSTGTYVCA